MTRQRGGATRRRDHRRQLPASPEAMGQLLRETRLERGLDLDTVERQVGLAPGVVGALESGALRSIGDREAAAACVSVYASFLTLDGDALGRQAAELWPPGPVGGPPLPGARPRTEIAATGLVTSVSTAPDHLRAFTQTGQIPRVGGGGTSVPFGTGSSAFVVSTGPPTSTLSVVQREAIQESKRARRKARRRRRAHWTLKLATWVVALLAAVAVAGVVVQQRDPRWFAQHHLLRVTAPGGAPVAAPAPPATRARTPTSAVVVPTGGGGGATSAAYTVAARRFTLRLATTAPCWVQVSSPASINPVFQGVLPAGSTTSYPTNQSLTVQVGASAVQLVVVVGGRSVFTTTPSNAPFTYSFTAAPAS